MLSRKIPLKSLADNALAVMGADSLHNYDFEKLRYALTEIIDDFLNRRLPLRRVVLVASLLKDCHVEIKDQNRLNKQILSEQKSDGGWIDCEDSTWSLFCLLGLKEYDEKILKGQLWLENEKCENEGWGFCKRDRPCIPITAQVLYFLSILYNHPLASLLSPCQKDRQQAYQRQRSKLSPTQRYQSRQGLAAELAGPSFPRYPDLSSRHL